MQRTRRNGLSALALAVMACAGCGGAAVGGTAGAVDPPSQKQAVDPVIVNPSAAVSPSRAAASPSARPVASSTPRPRPTPARQRKPLAGKVIGIDPGHNGRNKDDPSFINRLIWNGREWETCDTTGTETGGGYTEAQFNFNVASYLRTDLISEGAKVVMTRPNNTGVGPCVNKRAQIINAAHANVAIDIHADGGPARGRGFTVLEPVADGPNDKVIKASVRFGGDVRAAMLKYTTMPESDYYGHDGIILRNDLAGLNLTRVPKILIESGNMRNATDARLLTQSSFQRELAKAFAAAIVRFLAGH